MQTLVQSTSIQPLDTLILHIYQGAIANTFVYYEDDGKTFDYEKGVYYRRSIVYNPSQKTILLDKAEGSFTSKFKNILLVLHGFGDTDKISINGHSVDLQMAFISFLSTSSFDIKTVADNLNSCKTLTALIKNDSEKIVIKY